MRRLTLLLILIGLMGALQIATSEECPDFTLEDTDGDLFTLSDHIGDGPILIDFWATWCKPCKDELPHLQDIQEKYADEGLLLIAIAEDSPKTQAKVRPFTRSKGLTFRILLDPDSEVLHLLQGNTLPFRVLINTQGEIVETHQGYNPGDEKVLEETIRGLLYPEKTDE